jgi:intracellular septation protein
MSPKVKLLAAGLIPLIVFTVIEECWGTLAGLVAGMVFGIGEMVWDYRTQGRVDPMTWGGNVLLLILGAVSLLTDSGVWFKLQPAILEMGMAVFLWGSLLLKKSILLGLLQKQGGVPADWEESLQPGAREVLRQGFLGITFRLGLFFVLHSVWAIWAALYWSTGAWALLKGVGLTASLLGYMVAESLILRYRLKSIRIIPALTPEYLMK